MSLIQASIDVTKINKEALYKGKKGIYLPLSISDLREPDKYGNTHVIKQDLGKHIDDKMKRFKIIGNGKAWTEQFKPSVQQQEREPDQSDDIPF